MAERTLPENTDIRHGLASDLDKDVIDICNSQAKCKPLDIVAVNTYYSAFIHGKVWNRWVSKLGFENASMVSKLGRSNKHKTHL
jgi:hypothetical protein